MVNKDFVIETLQTMGFELEEMKGVGHLFEYEDVNYIFVSVPEDTDSIRILLPNIYMVTDENRQSVFETVMSVNCDVKYVKLFTIRDSVWGQYDHFCSGDVEEIYEVLENMIGALSFAYTEFYRQIESVGVIEEECDE